MATDWSDFWMPRPVLDRSERVNWCSLSHSISTAVKISMKQFPRSGSTSWLKSFSERHLVHKNNACIWRDDYDSIFFSHLRPFPGFRILEILEVLDSAEMEGWEHSSFLSTVSILHIIEGIHYHDRKAKQTCRNHNEIFEIHRIISNTFRMMCIDINYYRAGMWSAFLFHSTATCQVRIVTRLAKG